MLPSSEPPGEAQLRHHVEALADDSMMGRAVGSEGEFSSAEYIATEFRRIGLLPAGDRGTYFQTVPLSRFSADTSSAIIFGDSTARAGRDFAPANLGTGRRAFTAAQVIYGGLANGDTAKWISAEAAAGKFVILYWENGTPLFAARALASQRWHGAVALAIAEPYSGLYSTSATRYRRRYSILDSVRARIAPNAIWISQGLAARLLPDNPGRLKAGVVGMTVSGHFDFTRVQLTRPARNVIGILRGRNPKLRSEYVVVSAHHDHLGFDRAPVDFDSLRAYNAVMREMGEDTPRYTNVSWDRVHAALDSLRQIHRPRMDSIYNGADDDASGVASLLGAATLASHSARPARSILFISHTGEEIDRAGSRWFTDHPTVPLDSIMEEIDLEMVGRGRLTDAPSRMGVKAGPAYLEVIGAKRISRAFGDSLNAINRREGQPFTFNDEFDGFAYDLRGCRPGENSYARFGIPTVTFSRGTHADHEEVSDEAQYLDYAAIARVSHLVFSTATVFANLPHRMPTDMPIWTDPTPPCRL
jgi:hypothetical protein